METAKKKTGARVQGTKGPEPKAGAVGTFAGLRPGVPDDWRAEAAERARRA